MLPVRLPMKGMAEMRSGGLLPTGDAVLGRQTFAEWLAEQRPAAVA